jgi:hypothetical protein
MPYNHSIKAASPSGTAYTGRADGLFSLNEQVRFKSSGLWATAIAPPSAPTITSVTGGDGQATIAFTVSSLNGSTITGYIVTSSGGQTVSSATSPITITGLTNGTSYTFTVVANSAFGNSVSTSSSVTPLAPQPGQQAYTTPGTYTWIAPAGYTTVSVVAVGGGASGGRSTEAAIDNSSTYSMANGGSGGGLAWGNNIAVEPGQSYTVVVGAGGASQTTTNSLYGNAGGSSYFIDNSTLCATGGSPYWWAPGGYTGTKVGGGGTGGSGGSGGTNPRWANTDWQRFPACGSGGGGGAGGYTGSGGYGGAASYGYQSGPTGYTNHALYPNNYPGNGGISGVGSGGAGGGGAGGVLLSSNEVKNGKAGYNGGGVGILGGGASGVAPASYERINGNPGSGGSGMLYGAGSAGGNMVVTTTAALSHPCTSSISVAGGNGAVRIIWGANRSFPSTNTGDV